MTRSSDTLQSTCQRLERLEMRDGEDIGLYTRWERSALSFPQLKHLELLQEGANAAPLGSLHLFTRNAPSLRCIRIHDPGFVPESKESLVEKDIWWPYTQEHSASCGNDKCSDHQNHSIFIKLPTASPFPHLDRLIVVCGGRNGNLVNSFIESILQSAPNLNYLHLALNRCYRNRYPTNGKVRPYRCPRALSHHPNL